MDAIPQTEPSIAKQQRTTQAYAAAIDFMLGRIDYERSPKMPYTRRDLNLTRMRTLLQLLGNPHQGVKLIHVAGTKGKGSTCAFLCAALSAAGYRAGAYNSPHLHFLEERYLMGGKPCAPQMLIDAIEQVRPAVAEMDQQSDQTAWPTYFEIATAAAFLLFRTYRLDVGVLEVGLGGRLDSTNVCQPIATAITSISFDHTKQLGNTLEKIATEKAGIIKPGIPIVSGTTQPEATGTIEAIAQRQRAPLIQLHKDFRFNNYRNPGEAKSDPQATVDLEFLGAAPTTITDVPLGLLGEHQAANAAVAAAVLRATADSLVVDDEAIRTGFRATRCDARIEVVRTAPLTIIDAAHNVASAEALASVLRSSFPRKKNLLLIATTLEKDVEGILRILLPLFDTVVCTRYLNNPRAWDEQKLRNLVQSVSSQLHNSISIEAQSTPELAWQRVTSMAQPDALICVTGSFFIAAEVREILLKVG